MNITHTDLVAKLTKSGEQILAEFDADKAYLWHVVPCIAGEAGELIDAVKKYVIYNKPLDRANVIEELGDLEFYMEAVRQKLRISRQETLDKNVDKLCTRYTGAVYSDQAAQERADKQ